MCLFFRWWILRAFRLETNERCICILPHRCHTILLLETPCPLVRSYPTIFTPPHQSYMWACTLDFWRRETTTTGRTRRTRTSTIPIYYHNTTPHHTNILPQNHTAADLWANKALLTLPILVSAQKCAEVQNPIYDPKTKQKTADRWVAAELHNFILEIEYAFERSSQ